MKVNKSSVIVERGAGRVIVAFTFSEVALILFGVVALSCSVNLIIAVWVVKLASAVVVMLPLSSMLATVTVASA